VRRGTVPAVAALLLTGACSLNNRMHYLNRYAGEARRMEQAGRRFEAADYWGRATVKADSVLAHRPKGREAATALGVRGEALASLGQCVDASAALERALSLPLDVEDREYAALALARCQVQQGAYDLALASAGPVAESHSRYRREKARFILGSAERRLGHDSIAFDLLAGIPGREALLERTVAAVGAGRPDAAAALVDSLAALRDSTLPWDALVRDIGARSPDQASALVTHLMERNAIPTNRLPEFLMADAARLAATDTARQRARLEELVLLAPGSDAGVRARTTLALRAVATSREVADLPPALDSLESLGAGQAADAADSAARAIRRITAWVDSAPPGAPQGDMRRFLAAETAREVLRAPALAVNLFGSITEGWPASPYAAKAWLAARQLNGDTTTVLAYQDSPYLAVMRGGDATAFAQLEDSLARFASTELSVPRDGAYDGPQVGRPQPGGGQVAPGTGAPRQPARGARGQQQRGRRVEDLP
jgi:hypothetical protein